MFSKLIYFCYRRLQMWIKLYSLLNVLDPRICGGKNVVKNFLLTPLAALFVAYTTLKTVAPPVITTVS